VLISSATLTDKEMQSDNIYWCNRRTGNERPFQPYCCRARHPAVSGQTAAEFREFESPVIQGRYCTYYDTIGNETLVFT